MVSTPFVAQRDRRAARVWFQPQLEMLEDRLVPSYSLTDLGIPSGFSSVVPYALNNSGGIVALASTPGLALGEVELYSNGQWTPLAQAVSNTFFPVEINNNGEILGVVPATQTTPPQVYIFTNGQFTPLNPPAGFIYLSDPVGLDDAGNVFAELENPVTGSGGAALYNSSHNVWNFLPLLPNGIIPLALSINSNGQILATEGASGLTSYHAYIYTPNAVTPWTDLSSPNGGQFLGGALNDNGQVVVHTPGHFFIFSNTQWTDIGMPGGYPDVTARSFDNADQLLVNASVTANGPFHPYLYSGGQWIDLNTLVPAGSPITFSAADALNYNGQIVATGSENHAFLLTPLPPASPPPSAPPPAPGGGGSPTPVPFFSAVITLYIDGFEKILHDSPAIEQSIQDNLPWAVFAGFDIGNFVVLAGEMAALQAL